MAERMTNSNVEQIRFSRSTKCANVWSLPLPLAEEATIATWDAVEAEENEGSRSYAPTGHTFMALRALLFRIQHIAQGHSGEVDFSQLPRHVTKWINGVLRFMQKYDSSVWGCYDLGHSLGVLFAEIVPKNTGSKAAEIRVTRAARDAPFAAYESIRENPELMATVPAKNRPEVNLLPGPNASIRPGNPHSSTQVGAAHSQTNPERAYGQARSQHRKMQLIATNPYCSMLFLNVPQPIICDR